jgi:hypothetical protein
VAINASAPANPPRPPRTLHAVTDAELAAYETRFRQAGLPLFIEGYTPATDIFNRAAPLLLLVFIAEALGAIDAQWSVAGNIAAVVGGLLFLLAAYAVANALRGRRWSSPPRSMNAVELGFFIVVPGLLPLIFNGQWESGLVTMAGNFLLLVVIALFGYGLVAILRGAFVRLWTELGESVATLARAVPLLLLFAAVLFINADMWQVFSNVPGSFLAALAVIVFASGLLFLVAQLPAEVRRIEAQTPGTTPLTRRQRVNVGLIMLVSHGLQVMTVTVAIGGAFVVFGALAMGPEVYTQWLGHAGDELFTVHIFGHDAQVTTELLRVTGAVAGLSGLYYAIAVLTDSTYRDQFLDRLSADMTDVFSARARYLDARAARSN